MNRVEGRICYFICVMFVNSMCEGVEIGKLKAWGESGG